MKALREITPRALKVLIALMHARSNGSARVRISYSTLARRVGYSRSHTARACRELARGEVLTRISGRGEVLIVEINAESEITRDLSRLSGAVRAA